MLEIQAQLDHLRQERELEREAQALKAKKQSMQLQVQNSSDMDDVSQSDTYETCKTFPSDFSLMSSPTITEGHQSPLSIGSCEPEDEAEDTRKDDFSGSSEEASRTCTAGPSSGSGSTSAAPSSQAIMSDSGVCLDSRNQVLVQSGPGGNYKHSMRTSDEETNSCSSGDIERNPRRNRVYCPLHALRTKIAAQKALIMKNLETDVNKAQLDDQISDLQDLQRSYVQMEHQMLQSVQDLEAHAQCCAEDRASSELTNSIMRSSAMSPTSMEDSNSQIYTPSMTRSCPSMREFRKYNINICNCFANLTQFLIVHSRRRTLHYHTKFRDARCWQADALRI